MRINTKYNIDALKLLNLALKTNIIFITRCKFDQTMNVPLGAHNAQNTP